MQCVNSCYDSRMKKNILILILFSISLSLASTYLVSLDNDHSLTVHKTPTCGCCKKWMKHLESLDFETSPEDHQNLLPIKEKFGIKPEYRSCHTAVSKEGYVFEGHIPGEYISKFLAENNPNAIGLSVPGMPMGSPGMEVGDKFTPYDVLILYKDGTSEVYAEVRKN